MILANSLLKFNRYTKNQISYKYTDTFKKELDKWLMKVPDTPKIDGYGATVAAETNSIWHQTRFITK